MALKEKIMEESKKFAKICKVEELIKTYKDFKEFEKLSKNHDRKIIIEVRSRNNDYHNAESIVRLDISDMSNIFIDTILDNISGYKYLLENELNEILFKNKEGENSNE